MSKFIANVPLVVAKTSTCLFLMFAYDQLAMLLVFIYEIAFCKWKRAG